MKGNRNCYSVLSFDRGRNLEALALWPFPFFTFGKILGLFFCTHQYKGRKCKWRNQEIRPVLQGVRTRKGGRGRVGRGWSSYRGFVEKRRQIVGEQQPQWMGRRGDKHENISMFFFMSIFFHFLKSLEKICSILSFDSENSRRWPSLIHVWLFHFIQNDSAICLSSFQISYWKVSWNYSLVLFSY